MIDPTFVLKEVVLGGRPGSQLVVGAGVLFSHRPGKWREAMVISFAGLDAEGNVLVDLKVEGTTIVDDVPYGDGVRNWKFKREG